MPGNFRSEGLCGEERILVVEDDKAIRGLIVATLESRGIAHVATETGRAALAEIVRANPDVMLLDLGLPDMDGVEIIRKVRQWSMLPIIVISARSEDNDKVAALDARSGRLSDQTLQCGGTAGAVAGGLAARAL